MVFFAALYGRKSWASKKQDRKNIGAFDTPMLVEIQWIVNKTNKWIEQSTLEFSFEGPGSNYHTVNTL